MKKKKDGGTIKDWQVHTLTVSQEEIDRVYPGRKLKPMVITGTIVEDKAGRWPPGYHMRTSLVYKLDRDKGIVETNNSIYKLIGKEGTDILPDLGNGIMNMFY